MITKRWFAFVLAGLLAISFSACKRTVYYTVSFDSDGGTAVEAQTIAEGETAAKPADPVKEGFTFEGWYIGETAYDFSTPVTADVTLQAKWKEVELEEPEEPEVTYTVSFNSDGGSEVEAITVKEGEAAVKPEDPTKYGYKFVGWYLNGKEYDFSKAITKDIKLKAKWEIDYVTVTFDSNGGSEVSPSEVQKGETVGEPSAPKKAGYEFKGWYLGDEKFDFSTAITKNTTLVASWSKITDIKVSVTIVVDKEYSDVTIDESIEDKIVKLTASDGFDNYYWYFGSSTSDSYSGKEITIDFTSRPAGKYSITLKAYNNDDAENRYSKTVIVTVLE